LLYQKVRPNRINNVKRKLRRNDLCDCGSGKKFKKCCMFVGQQPMLTKESILYMKKELVYLKKKRKREADHPATADKGV